MGGKLTYYMGKYYIEYTINTKDTICVNIIDEILLAQVSFYVNEHIIVNDYIKQRVGPDSLTITNIHY